jgi:hypothetical protein
MQLVAHLSSFSSIYAVKTSPELSMADPFWGLKSLYAAAQELATPVNPASRPEHVFLGPLPTSHNMFNALLDASEEKGTSPIVNVVPSVQPMHSSQSITSH